MADGMTYLVCKSLPGLVPLLTEASKCSYLNLKIGQQ